jgi:O-acetyl-ADP-ribose deacetylase (regulator of RNase III)
MDEVHYHLRDHNLALVEAWQASFADTPNVETSHGDIFGVRADALISPANSFGDMTGGIDRAYAKRFGPALQQRLQSVILDRFGGEMPVGEAIVVETGDPGYAYLVCAPTMRVPLDVSGTVNAYLAFRAAIRAVVAHNAQATLGAGGRRPIGTVACPGLRTATGNIPYPVCAKQMRSAYEAAHSAVHRFATLNDALVDHYRMLRPEPN